MSVSKKAVPVDTVPTRNLTHHSKETMLAWIRDGKFPAGTQLPSVSDLVDQFQVSRTVVREALQALSGMNLIEIRPSLGCFVKVITSDLERFQVYYRGSGALRTTHGESLFRRPQEEAA